MTKRKADMSQEQHESVKRRNTELQKKRRMAMTEGDKAALKQRNREAQQRRREKLRHAVGQGDAAAGPSTSEQHCSIRGLSPLTPPPATPPPEDDLMDLVTGVAGIQVEADSPKIRWTSGQQTVLPSIRVRGNNSITNVLQRDMRYVEELAACPESLPSSSFVVYLSPHQDYGQVLLAAREALSENKSVVIRKFVNVNGFEFTEEGMYREFLSTPKLSLNAHDMVERAANFDNPYKETTLGEFLRGVNDPKQMRVTLDFALAQLTAPSPFEKLDDGLCVGWNQTQLEASVSDKLVPGDAWTMRSWGIAHHAGVLTYPHHDAEGAGTYVVPLSGVKNWTLIFPRDGAVDRKTLPKFLESLTDPDELPSKFFDRVRFETVHMYAGDLIIMPPGQLHTVYTPIAGFCRGGNYFNLDTMHLTELSRFVDHTKGKFVTNQVHHGTLETLCRIVLSLPGLPKARKLYGRSLICLCGMVLHHKQYTAQDGSDRELETLERAKKISKAVLEFFSISGYRAYARFLSDPLQDQISKGAEVNISEVLKDFQ